MQRKLGDLEVQYGGVVLSMLRNAREVLRMTDCKEGGLECWRFEEARQMVEGEEAWETGK